VTSFTLGLFCYLLQLNPFLVAKWWKRKDGVEEVEEAGLVNNRSGAL
jgi:hypothetical protein